MKRYLFLTGILLLNLFSYSQENKVTVNGERAHSAFIELGGNGIIVSANYDVRFAKTQNGFGGRVGIGGGADIINSPRSLSFPIAINYLAGKRSHFLETGLGATIYTLQGLSLFAKDVYKGGILFVPSLGYRYQPLHDGATFRIFASPLIGQSSTFWAGLSVGYKF